MSTEPQTIQVTIATIVGEHRFRMRIEDVRGVIASRGEYFERDGSAITVEQMEPTELAHWLAALWLQRAIEPKGALVYTIDGGGAVAVRPDAVVSIRAELTTARDVGFGAPDLGPGVRLAPSGDPQVIGPR